MTSATYISPRTGTLIWDGDAVVVGSGIAALDTAVTLREKGLSVCVIEPGATLGAEVSQYWQTALPQTPVTEEVRALCIRQGMPATGALDPFLATLAFDRVLLEKDIQAFVRLLPMRVTAAPDGRLTGVEVVGKSGRQTVAAKLIVDALPGRRLARQAAGLSPLKAEAIRPRLYVGNVRTDCGRAEFPVPAELGVKAAKVTVEPAAWPGEVTVSFELTAAAQDSSSINKFSILHTVTAVMTYLRQNVDAFAEAMLVAVNPASEPVFSVPVAAATDFAALARTGLVPLPSGADLAAEAGAAAELAAALKVPQHPAPLPSLPVPDAELTLESCELSAAPEQDLPEITLAAIPAIRHEMFDVVVAGAGVGGVFAGIAAAEDGAATAVLEPLEVPGGIGTVGMIHSYYHGLKGGIQDRVDEGVTGLGAVLGMNRGFHPVAKAEILAAELQKAGARVFTGHIVFGAVVEKGTVTGVLSAAEDGFHIFPCRTAVDATGDGDLAAAAGAEFSLGRDGDGFPQPYSYTPALITNGKVSGRNFDAGWVDPTDALDYSRAHFAGRQKLWAQGPFTTEFHYSALAPLLGLREGRFIKGEITLSYEDFMVGRTYPDAVCQAMAHHDNHAMDYAEESDWAYRHVVFFGMWRQMNTGYLPYRALYPEKISGLLLACRALSVDHDLHQLLRMQRDLQKIGEICGTAAALAVRLTTTPDLLAPDTLLKRLQERGLNLGAPPEPLLDARVDELITNLATDLKGQAMWRLTKIADTAAPDWDAVIAQTADAEARFAAAVTAALRGEAGSLAAGILHEVFKQRVAEPVSGVKSPPPFVVAALALAEGKLPQAGSCLTRLLLEEKLNATEIVLVLRAFAVLGDPQHCETIRAFLKNTESDEFPIVMWGCHKEWLTSFRFAVELRAVKTLGALGCTAEAHRLQKYLQDPHLLIRRHARRLARILNA